MEYLNFDIYTTNKTRKHNCKSTYNLVFLIIIYWHNWVLKFWHNTNKTRKHKQIVNLFIIWYFLNFLQMYTDTIEYLNFDTLQIEPINIKEF